MRMHPDDAWPIDLNYAHTFMDNEDINITRTFYDGEGNRTATTDRGTAVSTGNALSPGLAAIRPAA